MDLFTNDNSSVKLKLQECGGKKDYIFLRAEKWEGITSYNSFNRRNDFGSIFRHLNESIFQICQNSNECQPLVYEGQHADVAIRVAKPKKSCPKIVIERKSANTTSEYYVGNYPEKNNFEDDWSFLQPDVKFFEDEFLKKIEITFFSTTRSDAERARLEFLEDILNIIVK